MSYGRVPVMRCLHCKPQCLCWPIIGTNGARCGWCGQIFYFVGFYDGMPAADWKYRTRKDAS